MSGFPPPSPPDKKLSNIYRSPFLDDGDSHEEKKESLHQPASAQQTASSQKKTKDKPSAEATERPAGPRLRSKPSQGSMSPPVFDGNHKSDDHQALRHTAPTVSPRENGSSAQPGAKPPADMPPPLPSPLHSPTAYTHQGTATGSQRSPRTKASDKNSSKAQTHSYLISELEGTTGKRVIGHSLLAKQLIQAESCGYKVPLAGAKIDAILRGKVWLRVETDDDGKSIAQEENQNAIIRFCEPFMRNYFDTPLMRKNLDQVTENYKTQADIAGKLYKDLGAHNFNRSDDVQEIMIPVIAPIIDCICGKDNTIQSSEMPMPVLAAMLSLDEEVQRWYKKNGGDNPNELLLARKNALIGIFGVRAFLPDYATNLLQDVTAPKGYYQPLAGFLMAYLNKRLEQFVDSVMGCDGKQRELIKRQAEIVESRPVLPKSELEKIDQAKERFQSRKPSSLLVRLKDTVEGIGNKAEKSGVASPRRELKRQGTMSKEVPVSDDKEPKSPRSAESVKKNIGEESADAREIKKARDRQAVLNDYLKTLKLHSIKDLTELGDILRGFKEKIVNLSSAEYKNFKNEPDRIFHNFLREFVVQIQARQNDPSPGLMKFYVQLSNRLGLDDSE